MDRKSFLIVLIIVILYALYSLSKFKIPEFKYSAGSLIDIDKKALIIEKKPPVLSKNLADYEVWGVTKEIKKEDKKKDENKTKEIKPKQIPDIVKIEKKGGLYNICIKKECYEVLGIGDGYVVVYDPKNKKYFKLRKNSVLKGRVKVLRIDSNEILLFDEKKKEKLKIEYFKVDINKYAPKEKKK